MGAQMVYLREPVTTKETEEGAKKAEGECLEYGVCAMQGWRRNMEDSHLAHVELDKDISFFGVFDGHGGRGVSKFAAKHLGDYLKEDEEYKSGNYALALERCFLRVDVELRKVEGRQEVEALDRPDPGAPSHPIVVPRRVLQRFLGGRGKATVDDSDDEEEEEEEGGKGDKEEQAAKHNSKVLQAAEKAAEKEAAPGGDQEKPAVAGEPAKAVAAEPAKAAEEAAAEDDDAEGDENEADGDDADPEWGDEDMALVDPARLTRDASPEAQGCTAVVVLCVRPKEGGPARLFCANAGDSRAVLSRGGKVVALSEDHKPENDEETARITKAGGHVQHMPGGARVMGDLNLSRAMGDLRYKKPDHLPPAEQILTVFPEVRTFEMTEQDEFMVIGCDGIWERIDNQGVVDYVAPRIAAKGGDKAPSLSAVCGEICDRGLCPSMDMGENSTFDGTGCDNMTVMIVQLKKEITVLDDAARKRPMEGPAEGAPAGKQSKAE
mmetsp:Transcript_63852/g.167222  ORF Transcript_63852/g.167222 Transcript_63852/m.167222 type:complete len:493 (+) Transcript_63852:138-1616(+)